MATYLNETKNETLYKRKFFLPINEEDKRHNSLIFLLSDNFMGSYELRNNPFVLNMNRSFMSYYMEPNVKYYMNIQENTLTSNFESLDLTDEDAEVFGELNVLSESTDDKNYGLPDLKKYPMPDAKHVKSAIKFFNYVDAEHEEQLANAIKKNIKKFGIDHVNVGKKNRFSKYVKNMKQVTINESIEIPTGLKQFKAYFINDITKSEDAKILSHYRDKYPRLKNINLSDCDKGIIFVDKDDDVVGYVFVTCVANAKLKAFEISSVYRDKGYEYLLVDIAHYQYGAKYCEVPIGANITRKIFKELEWNETIDERKLLDGFVKKYAVYTIKENNDVITEGFDYRIENLTEELARNYGIVIPSFVDTVSGKILFTQDNGNYYAAAAYVLDNDTIVNMNYMSDAKILDLLRFTLKDGKVKYALIDDKYINILRMAGFEDYNDTLLKYNNKNPMTKIDNEYIQSIDLDRRLNFIEYPLSEDSFILTNEEADNIMNEANNQYSARLKTMLYKDRIKTNKEALRIYKSIREIDRNITKTFLNIDRYKGLNLFVDLYYYNNIFLKNLKLSPIKANDMYFKFLLGLLKDTRYDSNYFVKTVFIPVKVSEYGNKLKKDTYVWDYRNNVNVISTFAKVIREGNISLLSKLNGYTFVFIGNNGYFKTDKIIDMKYPKFVSLIKRLYNKELIGDTEENKDSPKAIKTFIVNSIETSKNVEINNLVGKTNKTKQDKIDRINSSKIITSADNKTKRVEKDKEELVNIIDYHAKSSTNVEDTIKSIDNTEIDAEWFKTVLKDLEKNSSNRVKIDATRAARMNDLNNKFLKKTVKDKSVEDLLKESQVNTPLPKTELHIDTVNEEWKDLEGANFEKAYDINEDIYSIIYSLKDKSYPVSIIDINKEDTSNSEDHVYTYTVSCEDSFGSRFTLKFDLPKFRNNRFMRLKGNEKTLNGQLLLLPIVKTDEDTVQIVTSYKKIFIRRYGESVGKSIPQADAIMKALDKYKGNNIKVIRGDNRRISSKYELPIDYLDLSKVYSKIIIKGQNNRDSYEFYFNQDEIREKYKIDETKGIPYGVMNGKNVLYFTGDGVLSNVIQAALLVSGDEEIKSLLEQVSRRKKYTYSRASILNSQIPLIVVMAYSEGLISSLNKAKITYELSEKRPRISNDEDLIKFKDGYLKYRIEYDSSLLLNGLKDCDTENYSIKDINDKEMWVDFLDAFGGRIKADGLDNFYDLTMDPITVDICKAYDLPTDYIEVLAYANLLLSDNKYSRHVDITGNRYRTNEQIASLFYEALCESYEQYKLQIKNGRNKPAMSMKQSIVIDKLMAQPTFSDLSVFSPVLEYEAANAVSFKGKSGMNSDRSYGLDKRIYDKSMVNVLALSTGFAGNVGLTRQTTIDKNVVGKRGLIKESDPKDMNTTKALCMTEALTPFGSTHDDPFRSAMTFIQSSKHSMRTMKQSPLLITNGSDEALPYLCSDMFAFKAKNKGKITEITKDYMIIQYSNNEKDFVDLRENIKKNSDGGVFEVLKLDTDLKVGDVVKEGQVVAYDKKSFVRNTGSGNLATSVGILSKVAILETDEGYEDSAIISKRLSENLMSQVVIQKQVLLDANTNVYKMIKKGKSINVGDTLMIIQNAFDDEDANTLLKNITDEELISTAGRIPITSKITGVVQDIKIYRSCDLEDMSDSLRKVVEDYESNIRKLKRVSKDSINNAAADLEPDYKLPPTGKLKNSPNHVLIEFYLRYDDKMSIGDKVVYYSALKGVTKDIFPEGKEPKSNFRPDEQIDTLLSIESINARMVGSIINTGCINKILIELGRKAREIMELPEIDKFE